MPRQTTTTSPKINILLWTVQAVLALMFLFAGGMKLVLPISALTQQTPVPGLFLRFIGVLEVLGGLGLVLPGILRLRPVLTPLAAAGLVIIMSGATGVTLMTAARASALVPVIVGLLAASAGYGRWRVSSRAQAGALQQTNGHQPRALRSAA